MPDLSADMPLTSKMGSGMDSEVRHEDNKSGMGGEIKPHCNCNKRFVPMGVVTEVPRSAFSKALVFVWVDTAAPVRATMSCAPLTKAP